ncbi:MAG: tetratricopeptide repeat protein [Candidatus Omnitrophica bacterium]|nr:tetratricopeptide repeat protein [Candidatus Omnitrophota bacterium]
MTLRVLVRRFSMLLAGVLAALVIVEVILQAGHWILVRQRQYMLRAALRRHTDVRIICLGESTTATGGADAYPALLENKLRHYTGSKRIQVINCGLVGVNTFQILQEFEKNLDRWRPSIVVAMMGINDRGVEKKSGNQLARGFEAWRVVKLFQLLRQHAQASVRAMLGREIIHSGQIERGRKNMPRLVSPRGHGGSEVRSAGEDSRIEGPCRGALCAAAPGMHYAGKPYPHPESYVRGLAYLGKEDSATALALFLNALTNAPDDPYVYVSIAFCYRLLQEEAIAKHYFDVALSLDPENDVALAGLGWWCRQQENFEQAGEWFERALRINPGNEDALLGLGWRQIDAREYTAAEPFFYTVLGLNPRRADAFMGLGWVCIGRKQYRAAQMFFERAKSFTPAQARALVGIGWANAHAGDPHAARAAFEEALRLNPFVEGAVKGLDYAYLLLVQQTRQVPADLLALIAARSANPDVLRLAAICYARQNQPAAAAEIIQRLSDNGVAEETIADTQLRVCVERNDFAAAEGIARSMLANSLDAPAAWTRLGIVLFRQSRYIEAEVFLNQSLALRPDDLDTLHLLIRCLKEQRKNNEAHRMAREGLARFPAEAALHELYGFLLMDQSEIAAARRHFLRALEVNVHSDIAKAGLVLCGVRSGDFSEAGGIDGRGSGAELNLAQAYAALAQSDLESAERLFLAVAEQLPFDRRARMGLVRICIKRQQWAAAERLLAALTEEGSEDAPVLFLRGMLYFEQNKFEMARDRYSELLAFWPADAAALYWRARCFQKLKDYPQAIVDCRSAIAAAPGREDVYELLAVLLRSTQADERQVTEVYQRLAQVNPDNPVARAAVQAGTGVPAPAQRSAAVTAGRQQAGTGHLPYFRDFTLANYRQLYRILAARNIPLVCVSYPCRDIAGLKQFLGNAPDIYYIDNGEVFRTAVQRDGRDRYFTDAFAGDFGHCTPAGNNLLAETVARPLIKYFFSDARDDAENN